MAHYAFAPSHGQVLQNTHPNPTNLEADASLPHSQHSSLNDSWNSQRSQIIPGSSGLYEPSQGIMTPSTTLSNKSSQERISIGDANETGALMVDHEPDPQGNIYSKDPPQEPSGYHRGYTSAPKRTASGEIKSPAYSLPTSPANPEQFRHSRKSSTTSRGSQIGELSTQLKTRLSYAMVKVQHGWQSHNINELEQLTSNQASPVSAGSDRRRPAALPVENCPSTGSPRFTQPSAHGSRIPEFGSGSPRKAAMSSVYGRHHEDIATDELRSSHVGAAYESFWREHEGSSGPNAKNAPNPSFGGPSLAPPVDILPRNARRLESTARQPPALRTSNLHHPDDYQNPRTPSPKKPKMRTPSQQAAVEKDAVETLLFMSSPGNSDYRPHTAPSGTPLRSEFTPRPSQTSHTRAVANSEAGPQAKQPGGTLLNSNPQQHRQPQSKGRLSDADINKMLDDMPDTSSSDDEDPLTR